MSAAAAADASSSKLYLPGQPIAGLAPPLPSTGYARLPFSQLTAYSAIRPSDARLVYAVMQSRHLQPRWGHRLELGRPG